MVFEFQKPDQHPINIKIGDKEYTYYVDEYTINHGIYAKAKMLETDALNSNTPEEIAVTYPARIKELCVDVFGEEVYNALSEFAEKNPYRLSKMVIQYLNTDFKEQYQQIIQVAYASKVSSLKPNKKR
jgi:hypothetical protein